MEVIRAASWEALGDAKAKSIEKDNITSFFVEVSINCGSSRVEHNSNLDRLEESQARNQTSVSSALFQEALCSTQHNPNTDFFSVNFAARTPTNHHIHFQQKFAKTSSSTMSTYNHYGPTTMEVLQSSMRLEKS